MNTIRLMLAAILATVFAGAVTAAPAAEKLAAIAQLKQEYAKGKPWITPANRINPVQELAKLNADGQFSDLAAAEANFRNRKWHEKKFNFDQFQRPTLAMLEKAFIRLQQIALALRDGKIPEAERASARARLDKAVLRYGEMELARGTHITAGRFHGSCFAIPQAAVWIYFSQLNDLESGAAPEVADMLKKLAFQAWSQPARNDATDRKVVSVDRFRKHVWWVGGNATGYRPLLEAALINDSPEMVDVLAEVVNRSISAVSQSTYDDAFWIEGFTADGAGWGHGRQCLIWGYPIDGTAGSLGIMGKLRNSPWRNSLDARAIEVLFDYLRGSGFYFYKGVIPPVVARGNATPQNSVVRPVPSLKIARMLDAQFRDRLTPEQQKELKAFLAEAPKNTLLMADQPAGNYHGTRYFYNNDDLIRKNRDYYVLVNMVSNRTNGLESAHGGASGYNLFTCDGQTLFERQGGESARAIGAAKLSMLPGITARQVDKLTPVTNWLGYGSAGKFAAGAVAPGGDAAAGFVFDKRNDAAGNKNFREPNPQILGVKAVKSYFFFGDLFLALGAGIENKAPQFDGNLFTTVEQTLAVKPEVRDGHFYNNGFVYGILPGTTGKIGHAVEKRTTCWRELAPQANRNAREEELEIFSVWIDHGKDVRDGRYAYWVGCDGKVPAALPRVLSNTAKLQAAELGNTVAAVFYDASARLASAHGEIAVSAPCAVVLQFGKDGVPVITAADGLMNPALRELTVTAGGKAYRLPLPEGLHCGKAVTR